MHVLIYGCMHGTVMINIHHKGEETDDTTLGQLLSQAEKDKRNRQNTTTKRTLHHEVGMDILVVPQ